MTDWSKSSYLDYTANGLTVAKPAANSSQSAVEAAFGITDGKAVISTQSTITVALTLERAKDPTALLSESWADRQKELSQDAENGGVGKIYGATDHDYKNALSELSKLGITPKTTDVLTSQASRTIWVDLTASQFQQLFNTPLMEGTQTIAPGDFGSAPGQYSAGSDGQIVYWNGNLAPTIATPLDGVWIERSSGLGSVLGSVPTPVVTDAEPATLPNGNLGIGNSSSNQDQLYPSAIARNYNFPLRDSNLSTPTVGIIANGIGENTGKGNPTLATDVTTYLAGNERSGSISISEGAIEASTHGPGKHGERSLDVSVVADINPNGDQVLYAGDGNGSFSSMQEAIWDNGDNQAGSARLGALTSSYEESQRPTPGSPFDAAYRGLMVDAALRNISVFFSSGDDGSAGGNGEGTPLSPYNHDSPYAVVVGGTSISTQDQAKTDPTLQTILKNALLGDKATLLQLVAGGLTFLPTSKTNVRPFVETTWNQATNKDGETKGLSGKQVGGGGVDTSFGAPDYQVSAGIDVKQLSGGQADTGRGVPDVAADAGGNTHYTVMGPEGDGLREHGDGGTSASSPLWAALTTQIQAIFADQGLYTTGYFNDLLYTAAAIAPGSFNDVTLGNNTTSFVYGGTTTDDGNVSITPTGQGYSASPGYDLATGLGTPNGLLLARALTEVAQAEVNSAGVTIPLTTADGGTSNADQALIVEGYVAPGTVDTNEAVTAAGASFTLTGADNQGWSAGVAEQVLQSRFDASLVQAISGLKQSGSTQITVSNGKSLATSVGAATATPYGEADTAPFGFVNLSDGAGNTVTYARPLAVAETYGGLNGTEAILRLRQTSSDADTIQLFRVDDLLGRIGSLSPGDKGYADAAAGRAYRTETGSTTTATPAQYQAAQINIEKVNEGDLIGFSLHDATANKTYWGFAAQNEGAGNALWSYGANTWGFNDGSGDGSFADTVFQLDFTSNAGSRLLAMDDVAACFVAGTAIATPLGERPVEQIAIGDEVLTADGRRRPVRWIGRRAYAGRFLQAQPGLHPIRFRPGSLGNGLPRRDLLVSPEHAMLIDDVLVPARCLVDGEAVVQETGLQSVSYVHIELESHDVILAEGAPSESFVDDNSRGIFQNAAEYAVLYPDAVAVPARFCRERLREGEALGVLRRRLAERRLVATHGPLLGRVERVGTSRISGWAFDGFNTGEKVSLRITADDVVLGIVTADRMRPDLSQAGYGDGRIGFECLLEPALSSDIPHVIRVTRVGCGTPLGNSPVLLQHGAANRHRHGAPALHGYIDSVSRSEVKGWAVDPAAALVPVEVQVLANGVLVARGTANRFRPDLQTAGIGNGWYAFEIAIPGGLSPLTRHVIEIRRETDGGPLAGGSVVLEAEEEFGPEIEEALRRTVDAVREQPARDRALSFMLAQADRLRRDAPSVRCEGKYALLIDERVPNATRDGGSQAVLGHARALRALGFRVELVATDTDPCGAGITWTLDEDGISPGASFYHSSIEEKLRRDTGRYELVYLHRIGPTSRYLGLVRAYQPNAYVIYSVADLHHLRLARQAAVQGDALLLSRSRILRNDELRTAAAVDAVITHSSAEAAILRRALPSVDVHCIGWAPQEACRPVRFDRRAGVVFVGSYDHVPNLDAATWLIEEVMPIVWRSNPRVECIMAGSAMPATLQRLAGPGITIAGHVPNLSGVLQRARLTVAPLRFGAGLKSKVLDSYAAGLPCALTPIAAEGMPLSSSLRTCIGHDAEELAAIILRLHDDSLFNRRTASAGRRLLSTHYDESVIAGCFEKLLSRQASTYDYDGRVELRV